VPFIYPLLECRDRADVDTSQLTLCKSSCVAYFSAVLDVCICLRRPGVPACVCSANRNFLLNHDDSRFRKINNRIVILCRRSTSSKIVDFGTNSKHMYNFLLMINNDVGPILHRFRDTATYLLKNCHFFYFLCV